MPLMAFYLAHTYLPTRRKQQSTFWATLFVMRLRRLAKRRHETAPTDFDSSVEDVGAAAAVAVFIPHAWQEQVHNWGHLII